MIDLRLGNCLEVLPGLPSGSVDSVITDPPYPEISRAYGRMTEAEWHAMMRRVVPEVRRVLKPTGSAVFVLQPNSRKVGSMRPWFWEFMAWACHKWNLIQDAYWWNFTAAPTVHVHRTKGLMRPSVKPCVWLGPPDCYRNQDAVLWTAAQSTWAIDRSDRALRRHPSGLTKRNRRILDCVRERGGSTPFNLLPVSNSDSGNGSVNVHGARTPLPLCSWWTRYLCPPGGTVLDPFSGTATVGLAALKHGCHYIGIEKMPEYHAIAEKRLAEAQATAA